MSFREYTVRERRIVAGGRNLTAEHRIVCFVLWATLGALLALYCCSCNTAIQGLNGLAKDAIIAGHAVRAATDRPSGAGMPQWQGGSGMLPPSGQGSMASDGVPAQGHSSSAGGDYVTRQDVEAVASSYGLDLQW